MRYHEYGKHSDEITRVFTTSRRKRVEKVRRESNFNDRSFGEFVDSLLGHVQKVHWCHNFHLTPTHFALNVSGVDDGVEADDFHLGVRKRPEIGVQDAVLDARDLRWTRRLGLLVFEGFVQEYWDPVFGRFGRGVSKRWYQSLQLTGVSSIDFHTSEYQSPNLWSTKNFYYPTYSYFFTLRYLYHIQEHWTFWKSRQFFMYLLSGYCQVLNALHWVD